MHSNINNHMSVDKLEFVQLISAGVVGAWNKIKSEIPFYGNSLPFMIVTHFHIVQCQFFFFFIPPYPFPPQRYHLKVQGILPIQRISTYHKIMPLFLCHNLLCFITLGHFKLLDCEFLESGSNCFLSFLIQYIIHAIHSIKVVK